MKGNNTLEMNEASMKEAVEFYLNKQHFREPVKVQSVSRGNDRYRIVFEQIEAPNETPEQ